MPANRSRTDRWLDCLHQVYERGGALEISIARDEDETGPDLVWRVRVMSITDDDIVVETPNAFGKSFSLRPGTELIGGLTIGQNRWMFRTEVTGTAMFNSGRGHEQACIRMALPANVERCSRRSHFRVSAASLNLPRVRCWPLIDPTSVVAAEVANRAQINDIRAGIVEAQDAGAEPLVLPEVGPAFNAKLVNIGGGGVGLKVDRGEASALDRTRMLWVRIDLRPEIPAPIGVTARVAHTHIDSAQNLYAGLAFDFAFNPAHRTFVLNEITRVVDKLRGGQQQAEAA